MDSAVEANLMIGQTPSQSRLEVGRLDGPHETGKESDDWPT